MIFRERWRPVVGFEKDYQVSDRGRVRSLYRAKTYSRIDHHSGLVIEVVRKFPGRILRPGTKETGHQIVILNGVTKKVHRLVLEAFVGPCPDGSECLHRDGVPSNNRKRSLRWGTRSENTFDAIAHGQKAIGSRRSQAKLTEQDIPLIRGMLASASLAAIGRAFSVSAATIARVRDGISWTHVKGATSC